MSHIFLMQYSPTLYQVLGRAHRGSIRLLVIMLYNIFQAFVEVLLVTWSYGVLWSATRGFISRYNCWSHCSKNAVEADFKSDGWLIG